MTLHRYEEIADTLAEEILRGQYRPGERLPSERDLAVRFEVTRGCVREAVKKLEQLRLANVQPGGARVVPLEDSSLEAFGRLLNLHELPDPELLDQVMQVMGALQALAAESAIARASDTDIAHARALISQLLDDRIGYSARTETAMALFRHLMASSGNLALRLIARTLQLHVFERRSRARPIKPDPRTADTYRPLLERLDRALADRDTAGGGRALAAMFEQTRTQVLATLERVRREQQGAPRPASKEVSIS